VSRAVAAPRPASRLAATFAALRARRERALVVYFAAGDPSLAMTRRLVVEAARRGADVIELGIPFSDPLADGPVIQRATQRALAAGATLPRVLELVREMRGGGGAARLRPTTTRVLAVGLGRLCRTAVEADRRRHRRRAARGKRTAARRGRPGGPRPDPSGGADVHPERMRRIARASQGSICSLAHRTGRRARGIPRAGPAARALRAITTKPVCVGFGIGTPGQAAEVGRVADGVIVGSAIVRLVERHGSSADLLPRVGDFIASLKAPLRADSR
jgi:tryptophan synthase alpha chain